MPVRTPYLKSLAQIRRTFLTQMFRICKKEVNVGPLVLQPPSNQQHEGWNDNQQGKAEAREQKPAPLLLRVPETHISIPS